MSGAFEVVLDRSTELSLAFLTEYIVSNRVEGLVLYFGEAAEQIVFKVNRGHIGVAMEKDERLVLSIPGAPL